MNFQYLLTHFDELFLLFEKLNSTIYRSSHILTIKPKVLETSGLKSLKKGNRINVNGYVRSIQFEIGSGAKRGSITIIPYNITMDAENYVQDMCIVMMTAYIESKIWDSGKFMSFSLRTHIPIR